MDKVDLGATRGTLLGTVSHLDLETGRPGRISCCCWIGPVEGEDVRHTSAKLS